MPASSPLETARLLLRAFTPADAPEVQRLAGDHDVASTTLLVPHPYPLEAAEKWIASHARQLADGTGVTFAITEREGHALVGAIGLTIAPVHARAEMGYWVGVPYWGRGYCTEAAATVLRFAFETLVLNRVYAYHLVRNPASGRVMQKIGMTHEGRLREHVRKWGVFEDVEQYAVLASAWREGGGGGGGGGGGNATSG